MARIPWGTFEREIDEGDVLDLIRSPDELGKLVDTLEGLVDHVAVGVAVDGVLALLARLEDATTDLTSLRRLQEAVVTVWSLTDTSGDRTRAERIVSTVDSLLAVGCSVIQYQSLVRNLLDNWSPFLTDRAFDLNLRAIEVLITGRPGGDPSVLAFAAPIFGRLTPESLRRLDPVDLLVAQAIAQELGLVVPQAELAEGAEDVVKGLSLPANFTVGLYSLDSGATRRAREVLLSQFDGIRISESHDKVSTESLRNIARSVDLMVVAVASAKHAATGAINDARGKMPLLKAAGKGSSSLIRAVFEYLESVSTPLAA